MLKTLPFLLLTFLTLQSVVVGQNSTTKFRVRGVVRDKGSSLIPGLSLAAAKNEEKSYGFSDMNGEFVMEFSVGDHTVTIPELENGEFRAFLTFVDVGPNLEFVEFVVDSSSLCRQSPGKYKYPAVTRSFTPRTPPAAMAVRAVGTVVVLTRIGLDGKVLSAEAVSGHPLLRKVSENAAQQFEFNPQEIKEEIELPLRFIFIDSSGPTKEVLRYSCPYRIVINREPVIIITRSH